MINSAKKAAYKALRKIKNKPDADSLKTLIESRGFAIINFNRIENSAVTEEFFSIEEIKNLAEKSDAFIYIKGRCKLLFVADGFNDDDLRFVLSHELGHILDERLYWDSGYTEIQKEQFANEFTHYLLHPGIFFNLTLLLSNIKIVTAAGLIIALALGGGIALRNFSIKKTATVHSGVIASDTVFVTSGGECYHKRTCSIVKNRTNIKKLSVEKALKNRYRPCNLCFSELSD